MAKGKIIIEGAKAFCSNSTTNNNKGKAVPINITSQKKKLGKNKYFAQNKPIATYLDDTFENFDNGKGFGTCKLPDNKTAPCAGICSIKYKDYYENVDFNKSMKVLLDVSTGTCEGYGQKGTIKFADSGQKGSVSQIDINEADAFAIANTSAIWETASSSSTKTSVSNIEIIKPFREKPKGTKNTYYFIKEPEPLQMFWQNNIQNDSMIHLEACASGDASKISWVLFKGTGIKDKIKTFIGLGTTFNCNLNTLFKDLEEGEYRIEAYGKNAGDDECAIIIEYVKDHVEGITVAGKSTVKNMPVPINISFKANSFSDFSKILNNNKLVDTSPVVSWRVLKEGAVLYNSYSTKDTSLLKVSIANESVRTTPVAVMTFKNAGKYTIEAYTDAQGTNRHTVSLEVKDTYGVNTISHKGSGLLRYNDILNVSVAKYSVDLLPTNAKVQWYLQKDGVRLNQFETAAIATNPNINKRIDHLVYSDAKAGSNYFGKYIIEAYGKALEASKSPSFKGSDAFSFEVIKNAADKISLPLHVPKGSKVKCEATARIMPLSNDEQLALQLPEGVTNNNDGTLTFTKNGEFKIEASVSGAYTEATKVSTTVKVTTPLLKRALWSYKTGYKRTETGFKEESYGFVEIEGLSNLSLKAKIWLKGDYDTYLAEPEKFLLEEKTIALNDQGKGYFKIATNDEYKKKMEAAIPATTENPTPTYSLIFTIELPENSSGATTLAENLEITHANLIVGTKMYSVLEPNEVLQVTNEQKVKSIVFATEDGKNVQQTLTYYGKTHKIWAHTVNMIDEELKIDVLREVPKENMNEDAAGIIVTHEAIETYNAEKVGPDGLLEVSFTLNEDCKIEGQTYDYYIAQVSKKVKDAADPSKESYQLLKSQVIVNDSLPASLAHDTEMEKMGIKAKKADGTPFTPEEMLTLRKKFINYEQGALKVAHTQATPEAVQNNNVFVEIESAEIETGKTCYCNKDLTEEDVKAIIKSVNGNDAIWGNTNCNIDDKSHKALTYQLNAMFRKYNINECIQKIAFLAMTSVETGFFQTAGEIAGNTSSSNYFYKGRGLLQLTGDGNQPVMYSDYQQVIGSSNDIITNPDLIAQKLFLAVDSGGWVWNQIKAPSWPARPKRSTETQPDFEAKMKAFEWKRNKFPKGLGKNLNEIALLMKENEEDYFFLICRMLQGYSPTSTSDYPTTLHLDRRKANLQKLKTWFKYNKNVCNNGGIMPELSGKLPWMDIAWEEYEKYKGLNNNISPLKEQVEIYFDNANYSNGKYSENWCAAFVTWCLSKSSVTYNPPSGLGTIRARAFAPKGKYATDHHWEEGTLTNNNTPAYGAIALIKWENGGEHVAFVIGKTSTGRIAVLGGNQSVRQNGVKIGSGITKSSAKLTEIKFFTYPSNFSDFNELYNLTSENITDSLTSSDTHQ
ncbi:CHAP domain-containing protein [Flavobacterium sp.]|uniref:CHAP domain-containing protein n=1 Tax=Flavobacterium sp. TaxID=239 RepID=UPI0040475970